MNIQKCKEMIAQFVSYWNMATSMEDKKENMGHIERYKQKLVSLENKEL